MVCLSMRLLSRCRDLGMTAPDQGCCKLPGAVANDSIITLPTFSKLIAVSWNARLNRPWRSQARPQPSLLLVHIVHSTLTDHESLSDNGATTIEGPESVRHHSMQGQRTPPHKAAAAYQSRSPEEKPLLHGCHTMFTHDSRHLSASNTIAKHTCRQGCQQTQSNQAPQPRILSWAE